GVGLDPSDRKLFFGASEIREIIAVRKTKRSTSQVMRTLDCTLTELNRWDREGQLPHRFKMRIQVGGKMVNARFWVAKDIEDAAPKVEYWRQVHEQQKKFRRRK